MNLLNNRQQKIYDDYVSKSDNYLLTMVNNQNKYQTIVIEIIKKILKERKSTARIIEEIEKNENEKLLIKQADFIEKKRIVYRKKRKKEVEFFFSKFKTKNTSELEFIISSENFNTSAKEACLKILLEKNIISQEIFNNRLLEIENKEINKKLKGNSNVTIGLGLIILGLVIFVVTLISTTGSGGYIILPFGLIIYGIRKVLS